MEPEPVRVLGVDYDHFHLANGADLYVTVLGRPFLELLWPDRFLTDQAWFEANAVRLSGTSAIYRVPTKPCGDRTRNLVVKWNRMGQDIPGAELVDDLTDAEFNSPFEEFSLVFELRGARHDPPGVVLTQRPLAIYASPEHVELWRSGRREHRMHAKIQSHPEIHLNMFRMYAVVYEWIKGIDAVEALDAGMLDAPQVAALTLASREDLGRKGFAVRDSKPHHLIVRPRAGRGLLRDRAGRIRYALVDFELLERTPEREALTRHRKRLSYLERQRDRFLPRDAREFPPHLKRTDVLGVPYVYGHAESTGGALWVVGNDPVLFDYFLPERWKTTPHTKLSHIHEIYHTLTRDNINLVWQVSRVGILPDADPFKEDERKILEHGYNSPFEEVALALELNRRGIPTTYPRAIYRTGSRSEFPGTPDDLRRYESHRDLRTPDGGPVLRQDRGYVIIWGFWNGPDEKLAACDAEYYEAIDALRAVKEKVLSRDDYFDLMRRMSARLRAVGIEDLNLRGNHLLLSLDSGGRLVRDADGQPHTRICNFELLRRLE